MEGDSTSEGVSGATGHSEKDPHQATHPPSPPSGPRWTCRYERSETGAERAGSDAPGSNTARHCTSREREQGERGEGWGGGVARHLCRSMQTAGLRAAAVHESLFQGAT